jgi:ABC-2 type transport system ATP-binding protein
MLQESAEVMLARGVAVTGPAEAIDRHSIGRNVIGSKTLGNTKSVMIYGSYDSAQIAMAESNGLQFEPIAMQDLFVHLTSPEGLAR